MNIIIKRVFLLNILLMLFSCSTTGGNEDSTILIKTSLGDIKVKLYDETPVHRDNFLKLVRSEFYDGISFHRVIKNFMIQAGDPLTRSSKEGLHDSLSTYTIPAEFLPHLFHKKGALAAAREGNDVNPEMRSSGTQFYIVQGTILSDAEIDQMEQRINSNMKQAVFNKYLKEVADSADKTGTTLNPAQVQEAASMKMFSYLTGYKEFKVPAGHREVYKTTGGVPRLDGSYTVFGEVTEGQEIVDKIAAVQTDGSDKPVNDVKILKMRIIKK